LKNGQPIAHYSFGYFLSRLALLTLFALYVSVFSETPNIYLLLSFLFHIILF